MVSFHEILKSFHSLGCQDEALCYAASRVYLYMTEEKCMHEVQYYYKPQTGLIYFTVKREASASAELVIPILSSEEINLIQLHHYRDAIELLDGRKVDSIVLAVCDSSSTVLLYKLTSGLKHIAEKLPSKGKLLKLRACEKEEEQ